jgi:hypothetical protein
VGKIIISVFWLASNDATGAFVPTPIPVPADTIFETLTESAVYDNPGPAVRLIV